MEQSLNSMICMCSPFRLCNDSALILASTWWTKLSEGLAWAFLLLTSSSATANTLYFSMEQRRDHRRKVIMKLKSSTQAIYIPLYSIWISLNIDGRYNLTQQSSSGKSEQYQPLDQLFCCIWFLPRHVRFLNLPLQRKEKYVATLVHSRTLYTIASNNNILPPFQSIKHISVH